MNIIINLFCFAFGAAIMAVCTASGRASELEECKRHKIEIFAGMTITQYETECIAMAIVNFTNETNGVDVTTRQVNNDKCFDFAVKKLNELMTSEHI